MESTGTMRVAVGRDSKTNTGERRRRVRHAVHTPAYASLSGNSQATVLDLSEILNISEEGMTIQTSAPPALGHPLNLYLDLSENSTYLQTTGHVVWADRSGRVGVRFPELPSASSRQLKEWLFLNAMIGCMNHTVAEAPLVLPHPVARPAVPAAITREVGVKATPEHSSPPDYTSTLTGLAAVKKEVEALGPDLGAALQLIATRAQVFTGATGTAIALSQGDDMLCVATAGQGAPELGARLQIGSGFSGESVRTGHLLHCFDSEIDPFVDRESCRTLNIRSLVAVPIRVGTSVIGLLEVFSPRPNAFTQNGDAVLQRLAETVLAAINRAAQSTIRTPAGKSSANTKSRTAAERISRAHSQRALLIAVAATLTMVVFWLFLPWVRARPAAASQMVVQPNRQPVAAKMMVDPGGSPTDLDGLRRLATRGDPAAQFDLGARYATGEDVKQDYSEALRWFSIAAEQGHVVSQATLGAYYWAGRGVPQDLSKAYYWSILAQAGGDQASKYRVAVLASRMSRAQVLAAQQQANDWIRQHQDAGMSPTASR